MKSDLQIVVKDCRRKMTLRISLVQAPLLVGLCGCVLGAEAPAIQLKGIAGFSSNQWALLEVTGKVGREREMMLRPGQRDGETEVVELDATAGRAKVRHAGQGLDLAFTAPAARGAPASSATAGSRGEGAFLRLERAGLGQVLSLYQLLARRTVLRPDSLPEVGLNLSCEAPATIKDLVHAIEQGLAQQGILLQPDGDKFVIAGEAGEAGKVTLQVRQLASTIRKTTGGAADPAGQIKAESAGEEIIAAGLIKFCKVDLEQALQVYAELTGRTLLRPGVLPTSDVTLETATPLNRSETVYAFTASLALDDISVVPVGEKFLFVVPTAVTNKLAALLARHAPHLADEEAAVPAGMIRLRAGLSEVVNLYHDVSGKPVERDADLPEVRMVLSNQSPLTRSEALWALDLLLGWEGLGVQRDGDVGLKLVELPATGGK